MTFVGVVGSSQDKFTKLGEKRARQIIRDVLVDGAVVVSSHSPLAGVDIWAEEEARALGRDTRIFKPAIEKWAEGYMLRNIEIAHLSEEMHVIVADRYPETYTGKRFEWCYHCNTRDHVVSGACWTAKRFFENRHKRAIWHIVGNDED